MSVLERIDNYLDEANDLKSNGFVKKGEWWTHSDYSGFKFKMDSRGKIMFKDPKGFTDTVRNMAELKNVLKEYKKK